MLGVPPLNFTARPGKDIHDLWTRGDPLHLVDLIKRWTNAAHMAPLRLPCPDAETEKKKKKRREEPVNEEYCLSTGISLLSLLQVVVFFVSTSEFVAF